MIKVRVHKNYYPFDIEKIEEKYNAVYLGDFTFKDKYGEWMDQPAAMFYQFNPNINKGHKEYFGLYTQNIYDGGTIEIGKTYILDGTSAFTKPFIAVITDDGYAISCFRHDYWESKDRKYMIDGGRDYTRTNENNKIIQLKMIHGEWKFLNK